MTRTYAEISATPLGGTPSVRDRREQQLLQPEQDLIHSPELSAQSLLPLLVLRQLSEMPQGVQPSLTADTPTSQRPFAAPPLPTGSLKYSHGDVLNRPAVRRDTDGAHWSLLVQMPCHPQAPFDVSV